MSTALSIRDDAKVIIEDIADDLRMALPSTIPLDRFKATFITAVAHNPEILQCEPQSIKTSLMKAASDNLMPDNREAALVPFNTKVKDANGKETWVKLAQYMPMVQGIRKRALELGGARITAECVYENDHFDAVLGDDPHIDHKPAKLGQPRGAIIGSYAIFKDADGTILHREIMAKDDIEATRKVSRAKEGPAWNSFFSEMARKAVVRRGSKSVPSLPDNLRAVIEREDEYVDFQLAERPRTIDHNPLLDTKVIENKPAVPMKTESKSSSASPFRADEGSAAGSRLATDAGAPANSSRTSPAEGAGEEARGSGNGGPAVEAARTNSPETTATADSHALTAADLKKAGAFLARQDSREKLDKAAAFIKRGGEDGSKVPNDADLKLLGALKAKLVKALESGDDGASDEVDTFNAHIDKVFGLEDFPGDL